ncbi:hypothetical protein P3T76_006124 [Phytophthora citrophthora]|uniref:RxLR effector protein n=1 Tax=Phytophthora citrophthora TaxID=4793 RepID=A0AAD9GQ50_9STRA|nr:hypothetical protein P3T76_006124 [Phytophthora citrophthora]
MRLNFILFAIVVALLVCLDAAVATEVSKRLRSVENGRYLKEKKTNANTKLSISDWTKEERGEGLIAWYFLLGPLFKTKSLDRIDSLGSFKTVKNHRRAPPRFETRADGAHLISEKKYQAGLARRVAEKAKNDEELAKK